jgi:hypothetical protein
MGVSNAKRTLVTTPSEAVEGKKPIWDKQDKEYEEKAYQTPSTNSKTQWNTTSLGAATNMMRSQRVLSQTPGRRKSRPN